MPHPFERVALYETIKECRAVQDKNETLGWSTGNVGLKFLEELGELAEAILILQGTIYHKESKEGNDAVMLEAADVIICMVDLLQRMYPTQAPDELYISLCAALDKKRTRWIDGEKGVNQSYDRLVDTGNRSG